MIKINNFFDNRVNNGLICIVIMTDFIIKEIFKNILILGGVFFFLIKGTLSDMNINSSEKTSSAILLLLQWVALIAIFSWSKVDHLSIHFMVSVTRIITQHLYL